MTDTLSAFALAGVARTGERPIAVRRGWQRHDVRWLRTGRQHPQRHRAADWCERGYKLVVVVAVDGVCEQASVRR